MKKIYIIFLIINLYHPVYSYVLHSDLKQDQNFKIKLLINEIIISYKEVFDVSIERVDSVNIVYDEKYKGEYSLFNSLRNNHDNIYWFITDYNKINMPQKSGINNVYGFCHEIGHSLIRFGDFNLDEGFADFTGTIIVDNIYDKLGPEGWLIPYDYKLLEGSKRYIERNILRLNASLKFSYSLYILYSKYGKGIFCDILKELKVESHNYNFGFITPNLFFELLAKKISGYDMFVFIINNT